MSDEFVIKRAERTQARLRLALQGSSGGGKTATSLLIAKGMVEALQARGVLPSHLDGAFIGLLDTERDSAKLYSHLVPFDTIVLEPPYTTDRYLRALSALEKVGYPVVIIDQISHEWSGEGGILEQVSQSKAMNEFARWNGPSQDHAKFIDRLLASPAHLVVTMRSKTEWLLEEKEVQGRMKKVVTRVGMQAKQREGTEYEFTTVLDLAVGTNSATCIKDRTELFQVGQTVGRMGAEWGRKFIEWVYSAKTPEPLREAEPTPEERATAVADAACRAIERAPNASDLQTIFEGGTKQLKGLSIEAGQDVIRPLLAKVIAAKDAKKAAFGLVGGGRPAGEGVETISPDDLVNLETLLNDAGVLANDFKFQFGIARLAVLPVTAWDNAQAWIVEQAGKRGITLAPCKRIPVEPEHPDPRAVAHEIVEKIADERGGLFAGMKDDIPWQAQG